MKIDLNKKNKDISVIAIEISPNDYQEKVQKILNDYRKKANIPGFRKGFVPMGMIKKQYELPVKVDEINKLVQNELGKYITENKLSIIGSPIPSEGDNINWKEENIKLSFDIATKPTFKINFKPKKPIVYYNITADKSMINNQVEAYQNQYGKLISVQNIEDNTNIIGVFSCEKINHTKDANFNSELLLKATFKKIFLNAKVGDILKLNTSKIFKNENDLHKITGIKKEKLNEVDEIDFKINELNKNEKAETNNDFFKKVYPNETIKSLNEFKSKIKEDIEKQFVNQSDQKFLNDVTDSFIKETKISLPEDFLKRLMKLNSKEEISSEDLEKEYSNSENGIKYQLIEEKLLIENDIQINADSIKEFATKMIKNQMAAYGQKEPEQKELDSILSRILSNQEEVKRISNQIISEKLLLIYKEKINKKDKKVSYEEYIEIAYKKNN
jgi:trigger factor